MKPTTKLVYFGRGATELEGTVNLPVYRASTIVSPNLHSYIHRFDDDRRYESITYGAHGTQNARALAQAVAALESGYKTVVTASGLSAVTMTLSALLSSGDHVLVTDAVYGPTRNFCQNVLTRYGVEVSFFDPGLGAEIVSQCRENTRLIFLEVPGSLTFEMQDIPGIARAARQRGALVVMDNTWATPLYFKPLEHGVDVSIQAGTKYIAGHADLVIGLVTTRDEACYRGIADQVMAFGDTAGPDDCYLALRGLRTLAVRLERQSRSAIQVASWLEQRPEVKRVLYPALPTDPGHALWKRDFGGAASLFGLALHTTDQTAVERMVDALELFRIGSSWGGYESLVAFNHMPVPRDVIPWTETPFLLRIHIGLEDPTDLIADLETAFKNL